MRKLIFLIGLLGLGLSVSAQSRFRGRVVDEHNHPIPGAHVVIDSRNSLRVTDEHGGFSFSLDPGVYQLDITLIGYDTLHEEIRVPAESSRTFTLHSAVIDIHEFLVESHTDVAHHSVDHEEISQEDLSRNVSGNLAQSLGKLPGITSINFGVGVGKPVIRGLSFNRVQVNSQGVKQEGQQWGSDHGLEIDQFDVTRLEVIKGPATLRYGSDALGGVVNVRPATAPQRNSFSASVDGIYKSNNDLWGTSVALAFNRDNWFVRGRYTALSFADFRVPAETFTYNTFRLRIPEQRLQNTAGEEENFSITGGVVRPWGATSVTWSRYNLLAGIFPGAMGIPRQYQLLPDGNSRDVTLPYQDIVHDKVTSNTQFYLGDLTLRLDVGYQQNDREEHSQPHAHGLESIDSSNTKALGLVLRTITVNPTVEWQWNRSWKFTGGTQSTFQENERSGYEYLVPDYTSFGTGVFGIFEYAWKPSWSWVGGIRYDWNQIDLGDRPEVLRDRGNGPQLIYPEEEGVTRTFSSMSGAIGVHFRPTARWEWKANAARSFRVPSVAELASSGIHHGTFRHEQGDADLRTEFGYQFDLGGTFRLKRLKIHAAGYLNWFQDYIYLRPTPFFSPLPEGGQVYQYTQHDAVYTGFEFSASYWIWRNVELSNQTDYVWNRNLDTELPLPFTPPLSSRTEVEWERNKAFGPIASTYVGVAHRFVAEQTHVDRNEPETPEANLWNLWAGATWQWKEFRLITRLEVQNIFDMPYLDHLSRYRIINLPEPGRNIVLRVTIPLDIRSDS